MLYFINTCYFAFLKGMIMGSLSSLNKISKYNKNIVFYPGHGDKTILKDELNR